MKKKSENSMKKRELTFDEKELVSFLDSSEGRNRSSSYVAFIERGYGSVLKLVRGAKIFLCHPNTLISLVGKGLIKISFGRVSLSSITHRSMKALIRDGYFEDLEV